MKINKYFTGYTQSYVINLRDEGLGEIRVARDKEWADPTRLEEWHEPTINWAACGNQSIEKLEIFIAAMSKAKWLAESLKNETRIYSEEIIDNSR